MSEPVMTELTVSYSLGRKFDLKRYGGYQYENLDVHLSETERWNVEGLDDDEIEEFRQARFEFLQARINDLHEEEENELTGGK